MKAKATDYLVYDEATGTYSENPEQRVRDDVEKHHWLHVLKIVIKDWRLYLMLIPMILIFLFWRYFPMYELLGCFKNNETASKVADQLFVGFYHFKRLLFTTGGSELSLTFWQAFRNTFVISFYGLCFGFPMPIILALFFNEIKSNVMRSIYQVLTYLPKFMSTVVMTSLITLLLQARQTGATEADPGVVSRLLAAIGLISQETADAGLLFDPKYFRAIYEISGIWETAGYDSIVFFAAVIAVSPTSYEAAQIDGAGKMAQMRYVVLPSILSTIVIMLITRIGSLLNVGYEKVLLLYDSRTYATADVISTFVYRKGLIDNNFSYSTAVGLFNSVVSCILLVLANKISHTLNDTGIW